MSDQTVDKFFVYGTLKEGGKFASKFDVERTDVKKATLTGFDLYDLGPFPCIVKSNESSPGTVVGELHSYADFDSVLRRFDMIEGYSEDPKTGKASDGCLYFRSIVPVLTESGDTMKAIVYHMSEERLNVVQNKVHLPKGMWVK